MPQQNHSHIQPAFHRLDMLLLQVHRVFLLDINPPVIRDNPQYRHTTNLFHLLYTRLEQTNIPTKLIDNNPLDTSLILRTLQGNRAISTGKHTTAVNIRHQNHIRPGMTRHRHIHQITVVQIHFRDTASTFHHNRVIASSQTVVRRIHFGTQFIVSLLSEIIVRTAVTYRTPVQYYLRPLVGSRFQQQRIHIRMARHASSLGLHSLRPANLQPLGGSIRVKCHILCLKRSRTVPVLQKDTAKRRSQDTFSHITPRSGKHYWV